jgi:hypothetical protein
LYASRAGVIITRVSTQAQGTPVATIDKTEEEVEIQRGQRALRFPIIWVAVRCTLQYVILPFVLPFFGLGGRFSIWISAALEVVALLMVTYNIQRLWNTSWRWRYLALSTITASAILLFLYQDMQELLR